MNRVREILLHVCVVCSFVCITAKVLDWYNPYMDFTGHIWGIQEALYLSAIVLGVTGNYVSPQRKPKQKKIAVHAGGKYTYPNRWQ